MSISKYENAVLLYFEGIDTSCAQACEVADISEAMNTCFHEVEINTECVYGGSDRFGGLSKEALSIAQTLVDAANEQFLGSRFKKMAVREATGLDIAVYGDGRKLALVHVYVDLRENDPKALMANGDVLENLEGYCWDDIRMLEAAQKLAA